MAKSAFIAFAIALSAVLSVPPRASAIEPGSAACKSELQGARKKMQESLALIDSVKDAPAAAKCPAYSAAGDLADQIRESAARCEAPQKRTSAVRDADDVIEAIDQAYKKWCPPRPGMVRVKMTMVTRVTPDKLPKPLAAVHKCAGDGDMYSTNERFDLGRLIMLGCPGIDSPTEEQIKQRNMRADLLQKEQAQVYLTRDKDGDDPKRLSFPILAADGRETATDTLLAGRVSIGDKLNLISAYWEPAKDGVCRIHAVWRVEDAKPKLVLWQEATDCTKGVGDMKTVLDRQ
jgi:hypothetical protein